MLQWLHRWALAYAPTPEKEAEKALNEARLALYRAEQRVRDALIYAEYYRDRVNFLQRVKDEGIESVTDARSAQRQSPQLATLRLHPKMATGE